MSKFLECFSRYAGIAFAHQLALSDFLGEHNWNVDVEKGVVDFGSGREFPVQLLGTESQESGTWLWAWANTQSNLPSKLLQKVEGVREFGRQQVLSELTNDSVDLGEVSGHELAMLSSGFAGNIPYYRGPYDGGALYFLVEKLPAKLFTPVATERAITVISELISQFELDARVMVTSFLSNHGFRPESQGNKLLFKRSEKELLEVEFDELGRILQMESQIQPHTEIRPWWKFW